MRLVRALIGYESKLKIKAFVLQASKKNRHKGIGQTIAVVPELRRLALVVGPGLGGLSLMYKGCLLR